MTICFSGTLFSQQTDSATTLPTITVTTKAEINQKVNSAFEKYFKGAMDERWYKLNKDYFVKFMQSDVSNSALFTKKGKLIYHITYGKEQNLPTNYLNMIKSSYPDFTITQAVNVEEGGRDIWVTNLENQKKLILVRFEQGEMEEVGNYDKSL